MRYVPKVGDKVVARLKVPSRIYFAIIAGPVVEVFENACRIATNVGTDIETSWQINYSDWSLQLLEPAE